MLFPTNIVVCNNLKEALAMKLQSGQLAYFVDARQCIDMVAGEIRNGCPTVEEVRDAVIELYSRNYRTAGRELSDFSKKWIMNQTLTHADRDELYARGWNTIHRRVDGTVLIEGHHVADMQVMLIEAMWAVDMVLSVGAVTWKGDSYGAYSDEYERRCGFHKLDSQLSDMVNMRALPNYHLEYRVEDLQLMWTAITWSDDWPQLTATWNSNVMVANGKLTKALKAALVLYPNVCKYDVEGKGIWINGLWVAIK